MQIHATPPVYLLYHIKANKAILKIQNVDKKFPASIRDCWIISKYKLQNSGKGNDSYFLLKKTPRTIVIVECGFLSNREEAEKLSAQLYQEKLAWNIHMGIMKYLNGVDESSK